MTINLSTFRDNVLTPQHLSKFIVVVTPPPLLTGPDDITKQLKLYVQEVNFPTFKFELGQARRYGFGVLEKHPISIELTDLTLVVLGDEQGQNYDFFNKWKNIVYDIDQNDIIGTTDRLSHFWTTSYKEEYSSLVEIYPLTTSLQATQKHCFFQAFPYSISGDNFNWGKTDTPSTFTVVLNFFQYKFEKLNTPINFASDR